MPSTVADSLFARLIEAFPAHRAYAVSSLDREPMPPPVGHFLKHWLAYRLRHEVARQTWPSSDWFDDEHEAVQEARGAFITALSAHGRFPAPVWEGSLREAVQQVTNYLVRPVATLEAFVFPEEASVVPLEVIGWRLDYFKPYAYFHEAIRGHIEQGQVQAMERHRFAELLRQAELRETAAYDAAAWCQVLAPLFDLTRRAGTADGIPIFMLQAFFGEKEAEPILERLHRLRHDTGVEVLDEAALGRLLEAPREPVRPPLTAPLPTAPVPSMQQETGPVPLWKQFQQARPSSPVAPAPRRSAPAARNGAAARPQAQEALPRWMQYRAEAPPEPDAPVSRATPAAPVDLTALEQAVLGATGARNRDMFITHLFSRSVEAYQRVLQHLYTALSWAEASKIIAEEVFRRHQVDIYSDPAVLFTDTIEARYGNRPL